MKPLPPRERPVFEAALGVIAAIVLALSVLMLGMCSHAYADIMTNSNGQTLGSPTFKTYTPGGGSHEQAVVVCDKTTADRCVTVDANGAIAITVTSSALPSGAATAAKQPALGTAGTASSDVLTIQGIASMTPVQTTITSALPTGTNVIGHVICDSGCSSTPSPSFGAAFPATGTPIGVTDGTNLVALRGRTGLIGASDLALVVAPKMPSDGTNTMPAGDSSARSIHVTVDNGSVTVTDNSALTLGTAAVAQTVSLGYGAVVSTPSTMTLGTNGAGMRHTFARAGQAIMQLNAPLGDWTKGKATATGTSDTSLVAALGSGVKFCMTDWAVSNSSPTDTTFRFRDDVGGSAADLTEALSAPNKGGNQGRFVTPICSSANKAFGFKADTGVDTLAVTVSGYKTQE